VILSTIVHRLTSWRTSFIVGTLLLGVLLPFEVASAHQPKLTVATITKVQNPEISKAYYGTLSNAPHVYQIVSDKPFGLYVNLLIPNAINQTKNIRVDIANKQTDLTLASLYAPKQDWPSFWEPFGRSNYRKGPEFRKRVPPGLYEIKVSSLEASTKYSLAVGEIEKFTLTDLFDAVQVIPTLKHDFFDEPVIDFALSPIGALYLAILMMAALLTGWIIHTGSSYLKPSTLKQISFRQRAFHLMVATGSLLWIVSTTWNPLLILVASYIVFEAITGRSFVRISFLTAKHY